MHNRYLYTSGGRDLIIVVYKIKSNINDDDENENEKKKTSYNVLFRIDGSAIITKSEPFNTQLYDT